MDQDDEDGRFTVALDLRIRTCRAEDLEPLEWCGLFSEHRELIRAAFRRQSLGEVVMLVADLQGYPVGQVWIDFRPTVRMGGATLWAVRVFPPLRGHGIGARLMRRAEQVAMNRGLRQVSLTVERGNPDARRFYERLGFRETGRKRDCFAYRTPSGDHVRLPLDQWVMSKDLALPPDQGGPPRCPGALSEAPTGAGMGGHG